MKSEDEDDNNDNNDEQYYTILMPKTSHNAVDGQPSSDSASLKPEYDSESAKSSDQLDVESREDAVSVHSVTNEKVEQFDNNDSVQLEDKLAQLETQNESLARENLILKMQLKKYIAAVQLLTYDEKRDETGVAPDLAFASADQRVLNHRIDILYNNEVNEYERKLVQVAEMHGELVEFTDHLHRVILQKEAIIQRLRDELIDLRGPLTECNRSTDDIASIVSDLNTSISGQSSLAHHPLINVWIPTAFLAGGQKNSSHHVYQIYVRIREDEWNVYRRYSQFHALHKSLRKKWPHLNTFDFPPKKALGNRDSRVVQERRKKLEHYMRCLINYLQIQNGGDIGDKDRLIEVLPFLSERVVPLSDGRSRSDTHLNIQPNSNAIGSTVTNLHQHYIGL